MTDQLKQKNPYSNPAPTTNSYKLISILSMSAVALVGLFIYLKTYSNHIDTAAPTAQLASASPTAGAATTQTYPNQTNGTYAPTPSTGGNNPSNTNPSPYGNTHPGDTSSDMTSPPNSMGTGTDMTISGSGDGTPSTNNNAAPMTSPHTMHDDTAVGGSLNPSGPPTVDNRNGSNDMSTMPAPDNSNQNNDVNSMGNSSMGNSGGDSAFPANNDALNNQGPDSSGN